MKAALARALVLVGALCFTDAALAQAPPATQNTAPVLEEGFCWVVLGQNPPEIAYWERGEWWLAGDPKP